MRPDLCFDPHDFARAVEAAGTTYAQIGRDLAVSEKTVRRWRDKGRASFYAATYIRANLPAVILAPCPDERGATPTEFDLLELDTRALLRSAFERLQRVEERLDELEDQSSGPRSSRANGETR